MNRREFLAAGFKLGAAGLLLPAIEPIRRYWSLDRTMIPGHPFIWRDGWHHSGLVGPSVSLDWTSAWVDMSMPPFTRIESTITVGDYRFPMSKGGRLQGDSFVMTAISSDEWVIHE